MYGAAFRATITYPSHNHDQMVAITIIVFLLFQTSDSDENKAPGSRNYGHHIHDRDIQRRLNR